MVLLIDTNIILDYLLKREPFYNNAKAVMEKCCLDDFHGYMRFIPLQPCGISCEEFLMLQGG